MTTGRKRSHDEISSSEQDEHPSSSSSSSLLNNHFHSQLPSYLSEAFSDLYAQDGLVVMGRGLGWLGLLAAFCRFYADPDGYCAQQQEEEVDANHATNDAFGGVYTYDSEGKRRAKNNTDVRGSGGDPTFKRKTPLIFLLNLRENERSVLLSTLSSWGMPASHLPTLITNESGPTKDRSALYARGGLFIITSRILIVDLLNGTARPRSIAGMLVAHAERVDECSTEAFILRIFRGGHDYFGGNGGFVKAFSDDASSLVRGFAKIDKIMKCLRVPKLYLYPRFRSSVAQELEEYPPSVEELHVELSASMKRIQSAIAAAVRACMRDLRGRCPTVDFSELLSSAEEDGSGKKRRKMDGFVENGSKSKQWEIDIKKIVSTNFDMILSKQLQGDWHRLSPSVKQRISDLTSLRKLFYQLIQSDCVSFWRTLEGIKARSVGHSSWILDRVGEKLFELAKDRVYRIAPSNGKVAGKLVRVLEENPKERLVQQILTEIQNRWDAKASDDGPRSANVLMMVRDGFTLRSLQSFISLGKDAAMEEKWRRYLKIVNEKTKSIISSVNGGIDSLNDEQRLLFENDFADKNIVDLNETLREQDRKSDKKRRHDKITTERTRGRVDADSIRDRAQLEEVLEESRMDFVAEPTVKTQVDLSDDESTSNSSSDDDSLDLIFKVKPLEGLNLVIRSFDKLDDGEAELLLRDIMPSYVVLYDSEPSFVRALEIYSNAIHALDETADKLQVFFISYANSAEESSFLQTLDREKKAFDRLIDSQKRMPNVLPTFNNFTTQEMQMSRGGAGGSYAGGSLPLSMDTRKGGGKQAEKERRDIAVDVREFRSSLPSILHQGGMRLAPVTLTVGDFVLSNVHCVERKSISDLFGSLASGRLYSQAEAMSKHYKCPCLLIEFDPEKTFELQSKHELGGDIKMDSICSKLVLLIMHFPKLRILWSRSPHETLKLFKQLKRNHQEVDVDKAVEIGNNDSLDDLLFGGADGYDDYDDTDEKNETAQRMLLRLPGVTPHNARKIMSEVESIAELAELSRDDLKSMIGPVAGQKLFTFFRQRFNA